MIFKSYGIVLIFVYKTVCVHFSHCSRFGEPGSFAEVVSAFVCCSQVQEVL